MSLVSGGGPARSTIAALLAIRGRDVVLLEKSRGVFLAMHSAFLGADTVETCLDQPRRAERALKTYDASVRRGIRAFSWFICRVTASGLREIFMNPDNRYRLRDALLAVLAGNIFRANLMAWKLRRQATQEPGAETPQPSS